MSRLDEVGERDHWRCWICDEPVDPQMSVNDTRGPSIDSRSAKPGGTAKTRRAGVSPPMERLAHRGCNTKKGAVAAIIPWPADLFVAEPAAILTGVERLRRKGGREIMARCPTDSDARQAATWLAERVGRLEPELGATTEFERGGGQFLVVLRA